MGSDGVRVPPSSTVGYKVRCTMFIVIIVFDIEREDRGSMVQEEVPPCTVAGY